ncbi:hypothetical protein [Deinococcus alpinitundrae]|uniref:hypothetical protein n=1 Tax=Deinococcus alpinitundrae TaxID=468913 RepID=UPI001ED90390|nr:hypothetical protein [Deinococcus alpinitundrae]
MIAEKSTGWRVLSVLVRTLLWLLAAVLAALALGAFASLNPAAPTWMRTLGALEGVLEGRLFGGADVAGAGVPGAYPRGLTEALLSALAVFLAARPAARATPTPR